MWKLLKALAALGLVFALLSGGTAWYVTATHKPTLERDSSTAGIAVEDVEFPSSDGTMLRGWYAPGSPGSPAVAIFHGHHGTRADGLPIARALSLLGYDLLLVDLRGCGASGGTLQTLGVKEALDVAAGYRFLRDSRPHSPRRIGLLGIGTGASAVILAHEAIRECGAVALLGPYASLEGAIDRRMKQRAGIGLEPAGLLVAEMIRMRIGSAPATVRPVDAVGKLAPCPVLFVGAGNDGTTPPLEIQELYERSLEPKELFIAPGIARERLLDLSGSHIGQKLKDFFEENLR